MTGENGTPETPEWDVEPRMCPPLDAVSRARMLNTTPATTYQARPADQRDGVIVTDAHLIRGEN